MLPSEYANVFVALLDSKNYVRTALRMMAEKAVRDGIQIEVDCGDVELREWNTGVSLHTLLVAGAPVAQWERTVVGQMYERYSGEVDWVVERSITPTGIALILDVAGIVDPVPDVPVPECVAA
jgi:hypothetical protein